MEETLFKLTRAITDTGTDTVPSKGGTVAYRITSLKRKLVNGKVVSTSTPSCTLDSAPVSWATYGGIVTVGDGYLDVKINYSENTGPSRSTTLTFAQNESNNKINLTVTQTTAKITVVNIIIRISKSLTSNTSASVDIMADQLVNSSITFIVEIQYGVSSGDVREYIYTLVKGSAISRNTIAIQDGANPQIVDYSYSPREDSKYIYNVSQLI